MTKRIFLIFFLFLGKLDLVNATGLAASPRPFARPTTAAASAPANCEAARQAALSDCNAAYIQAPMQFVEHVKTVSTRVGTVPVLQTSLASGGTSQRQLDEFQRKCYDSFTGCKSLCQQEAAEQNTNQNFQAAQQAEQAAQQCAGEPAVTQAAAQKASMDLSQILPLLGGLLSALKGDGGASGDACIKDPESCKVDTATNSAGTTLANNTARTASDGGYLDSGLNPNDAPPMGEAAEASLAQFGQAPSGGGGASFGGGTGTAGGRGRGVAEVNADGTPKINLNPAGGAGGGKNGGMSMSASSANKSSGNPSASRVSIDGAGTAGGSVGNAVDKAMQARGLASGQAGGVTAAHAFDNFQKIEKRIQSERNKLAEL